MTTTIFAAAPSNISDATFRAWGSGLSAAFAAVGLVKTSDTGQIDWSTVLAPTVGNTYMGYEIWRLNDSLQATAPIFFKIEYGGSTTFASPSWRWTIGKGSDGSGAITGTILAATVFTSATNTLTISNWYVSSGDGSMIAIAPAPTAFAGTAAADTWYMVIERSRSAAGVATGTGLIMVYGTSAGAVPGIKQWNYALTTGPAGYYGFPVGLPFPNASPGVSYGGIIPMFPGTCADGAGNFWQPRSLLVGHKDDIGSLNQVSVPGWGTYLPITGMLNFGTSGTSTSRAAIAWY